MYDRLLDTFIAVVDAKSFTKAAESIFVTPTGIMKQINALEEKLDVKLIERSPMGIKLTPQGKIIYDGAKFMKDYALKTIAEAKSLEDKYDKTFCIGSSLLNPVKPFMDLWYKVNGEFSEYKLHLVPFNDDSNGIISEIRKLGEKFDFLIGVCNSRTWLNLCNFLPLGRYKKMIAVSREHRLATKKIIKIDDLHGETLMMVKRGDSGVNDFLRNDLELNHPEITIEDTSQFYDMSVFNRCAETKNVLLTIECWRDVHPALITIPVEWDYSIPYGLLYAQNAPKDVFKFINKVKDLTLANY